MPVLRNARYEAFCQALAAGKSAGKAYEFAGFAPSYANASRLQRQDRIRQRVEEVLDQKQRAADKAMATAAEKAGLDHFWVLRSLRRNATMAARAGDRAASNRAIELIGRHLGVFIDKKQIEINVMDDADRYLQQLLELVGQPVSPLLEHDANEGQKDGSDADPEADTTEIIEEVY